MSAFYIPTQSEPPWCEHAGIIQLKEGSPRRPTECLSVLKYAPVLIKNKQQHFVQVYLLDTVPFVHSPKVVLNILVEK